MHFLRTLFWVVIAVFLAIIATRNWHDVTLNLWGDIQADIKLPVLLFLLFLLGFLPPFLVLRAQLWRLRRRLDNAERQQVAERQQGPGARPVEAEPSIVS